MIEDSSATGLKEQKTCFTLATGDEAVLSWRPPECFCGAKPDTDWCLAHRCEPSEVGLGGGDRLLLVRLDVLTADPAEDLQERVLDPRREA